MVSARFGRHEESCQPSAKPDGDNQRIATVAVSPIRMLAPVPASRANETIGPADKQPSTAGMLLRWQFVAVRHKADFPRISPGNAPYTGYTGALCRFILLSPYHTPLPAGRLAGFFC